MGDRYGRLDINEISIGVSKWDMCYRFGIRCINMVIYHIDMVIRDIDMGDEATDMGDDIIDMVISHIDMGYLVTVPGRSRSKYPSTYKLNPRFLRYDKYIQPACLRNFSRRHKWRWPISNDRRSIRHIGFYVADLTVN